MRFVHFMIPRLLAEASVLPSFKRNQSIDPTVHKPLKDSDVIRVYHGFNNIKDLFQTLKTGLSGKERAPRIHSYEYNNNPKGLFVSIALSVSKQFGNYVAEFHAKVSDLEAPVWPNGAYTTQGELAGTFADQERESTQLKRRQSASPSKFDSVKNSDRPELAELLYDSSEQQALFTGNLNNNSVRAIWVSTTPEKDGTYSTFKRMSVKEFMAEYGHQLAQKKMEHKFRVMQPRDTFEIEEFLTKLEATVGKKNRMSRKDIIDAFHYVTKDDLLTYVWPHQLNDAWDAIQKLN